MTTLFTVAQGNQKPKAYMPAGVWFLLPNAAQNEVVLCAGVYRAFGSGSKKTARPRNIIRKD